ncbi:MAG: cytochrome P450 [Gammaproteobacteria bacterium]|jgi:cytochrome P450|nr:cytochrome P450 [Gammaproteobacteria bacterium]MBT5205175.1 cytochrome P450 [Gammaproteobacteria bacterium]MBT5602933.1 cytochrome P450 [Gammaproteobacteria bacterium]MBT6244342.1 cytochrome P450 [Gammaproteobacteria bacterium]
MDLFSIENLLDPYPAYKQMRDDVSPVYFDEGMNLHVVTRYDLLREVLKRTDDFSSKFDAFMANTRQAALARLSSSVLAELSRISKGLIDTPPTMLTLDEPDHSQYRNLVAKLFTGSQIRQSEAGVRRVIDTKLADLCSSTETDFMSVFAFPVPLEIISERLGIPVQDRGFFYEAATAAASALKMTPVDDDEMLHRAELAVGLQQLLIGIIELRRRQPEEDMITLLATSHLEIEDRLLTHGEALSILGQFLVAGHETTTSSFGWAMLQLCRQPGLQDLIRGDEKRTKVFVEEALRLEAPVQGLPRRVTRDTQLAGYSFSQGDMIMLRFGSANRDDRQFDNPDEIDLSREKAGLQMSFGSGPHHCIGAPLARQELNIGFMEIMKRIQSITLDPLQPEPLAEPSFILRGLAKLPIAFELRK